MSQFSFFTGLQLLDYGLFSLLINEWLIILECQTWWHMLTTAQSVFFRLFTQSDQQSEKTRHPFNIYISKSTAERLSLLITYWFLCLVNQSIKCQSQSPRLFTQFIMMQKREKWKVGFSKCLAFLSNKWQSIIKKKLLISFLSIDWLFQL